MKSLNKEQRLTLCKLFNANLGGLSHMPFSLRGRVMYELNRALSEMDRLTSATSSVRHTARKCRLCGVLSQRGTYFHGKKEWLCLECSPGRLERIEHRKRHEGIEAEVRS